MRAAIPPELHLGIIMPFVSTYVGRLRDLKPIDPTGETPSDLPHPISPDIPGGSRTFGALMDRVARREYTVVRGDVAGFAVPITKAQGETFLSEEFGDAPSESERDQLEAFRGWLAAAEDDGTRALVTSEL